MVQGAKRSSWRHRFTVIALVIVALVALLGIGFLIYASDYYRDLDTSHTNLVSTSEMPVEHGDEFLAFGDPDSTTALVFYPGAKIEYCAYAPLMREIAQNDILCIVVHMPFNFAFFDPGAAQPVMDLYPQVEHWWIGGHSLGGAMAASHVADNAKDFEGLILLGSYTASDLTATDLSVLSVYGSNDEVLNRESLAEGRELVPPVYTEEEIEGGNHAYFGNYGEQDGDGQATISPDAQREETAAYVTEIMRSRE